MANPFKKIAANAKETAKKWESEKQNSSIETITCPQCGAPRSVNTNISNCSYCRFQFMETTVMIKRQHKHE